MADKKYRPGCNAEGYPDHTATEAINNITRAEKDADRRAGLRMRIIKDLLNLAGLFTQWNGEPMVPDTAGHWLEKFCDANGLPRVCVYSFRHLNESLLIEA